ncbi:hypothetical protein [Tsukamurella pseudospumae]|uniref:hypothetical protein n=1 Tax=Tsukamurella pseudospumae TaxID=239498 RepID=UPI000838192B|nr:hypothetical protein [Tsukamurella pseudospumae]
MATSSTDPYEGGTTPADGETVPAEGDSGHAVGKAVTAFAGTDREVAGEIVEDFGEFTPVATEYDGERIAEPARRWAVLSDAGDLVFADTADLTARPA